MPKSVKDLITSLEGSTDFLEVAGAFEGHIELLFYLSGWIDCVYAGKHLDEIGDVALRPRHFVRAQPGLIAALIACVEERAAHHYLPRAEVRAHISDIWVKPLLRQRRCLDSTHAQQTQLREQIIQEVPRYSALQLALLLQQIRRGSVNSNLVAELRYARDGRLLTLAQARHASISSEDIFQASRLLGGIDIVHANRDVLVELLQDKKKGLSMGQVKASVMQEIARLGYETGTSLPEYAQFLEKIHRRVS